MEFPAIEPPKAQIEALSWITMKFKGIQGKLDTKEAIIIFTFKT